MLDCFSDVAKAASLKWDGDTDTGQMVVGAAGTVITNLKSTKAKCNGLVT